VLLVDDEPLILSALERSLRREGYELRTARSPAQALGVLAKEPVDLVVSDFKMPGGTTGLAFLEEAQARFGPLRRVLLTGWPEEIGRDRAARSLDAILGKPWDDAELKATLRRLLAA
jgi:CheY-like chemotaxis protein